MRTLVALFTLLALAPSASAQFDESFEGVPVGTFPPNWMDAAVLPSIGSLPVPSVTVVNTASPLGPTRALSTLAGIGSSQGIYRSVNPGPHHRIAADVRIDQYSNGGSAPASDWAIAVGVNQLTGGNLALAPSVQIYASTQSQQWRVFAFPTTTFGVEFSLGVPALVGTWYRVQLDLTTQTGVIRTRIWDLQTGQLIDDQTNQVAGWVPGAFDAVGLIDGEDGASTIPNLATVDNISYGLCPSGLPLESNVNAISVSVGGTQALCLDAGAANAGRLYLLAGTTSGTQPGFPLNGMNIPLNIDAYTMYTLQNPNNPILVGSIGLLDANGRASASANLTPLVLPGFTGATAHHVFVLAGPTGVDFVSNAEPLQLNP